MVFLEFNRANKSLRFDFLAFGQQAGIRAQHFDEGMDFGLGSFAELDEVVAFLGREKVVGVNLVELGVHAVDAPDALNEARRIPWDVVIDDDVGAVKVHAFGQNFGGDEDAVVVLGMPHLGIEVGNDFGRGRSRCETPVKTRTLGSTSFAICAARYSAVSLDSVKMMSLPFLRCGLGFENVGEGFPLGIAGDFFPMVADGVEDFQVVLEVGDERRP